MYERKYIRSLPVQFLGNVTGTDWCAQNPFETVGHDGKHKYIIISNIKRNSFKVFFSPIFSSTEDLENLQ